MAVAYEIVGQDIPLEAAEDLSTNQFYIMQISGDNTVNLADEVSLPFGILQNKPKVAGRAANVRISGLSKCEAGGNISAGDPIASDGSGAGVKASADKYMIGIAVIGVSSGEVFTLRIGTGALSS